MKNFDNTKKNFFRWSIILVAVISLFWVVWYIVNGSVPTTTEIEILTGSVYILPFAISRWLDIPMMVAILFLLTLLFNKAKKRIEMYSMFPSAYYEKEFFASFFFFLGLIFSSYFGLIFGLYSTIPTKVCLIMSIWLSLLSGLALGLYYAKLLFDKDQEETLQRGLYLGINVGLIGGIAFGSFSGGKLYQFSAIAGFNLDIFVLTAFPLAFLFIGTFGLSSLFTYMPFDLIYIYKTRIKNSVPDMSDYSQDLDDFQFEDFNN